MATKLGFQTNLPEMKSTAVAKTGKSMSDRAVAEVIAQPKPGRTQQERQAFLNALRHNKDLFSASAVIARAEKISKKV